MSRAATAPQLQAPQPDISAGPRPGLRPLLPSGSQQSDSYSKGALNWLQNLPPTLGPVQSSPVWRLGLRTLRAPLSSTQYSRHLTPFPPSPPPRSSPPAPPPSTRPGERARACVLGLWMGRGRALRVRT